MLRLMLVSGNSLKVTSELLCHSTITLTADTYTHVIDDLKKEAAKKLIIFYLIEALKISLRPTKLSDIT